MTPDIVPPSPETLQRFVSDFERSLAQLAEAPAFSKYGYQLQLLARGAKLLKSETGLVALHGFAPGFDDSGIFIGSDWADPAGLQAALVGPTLRAGGDMAVLECLSELRLLAIAEGSAQSAHITPDQAREFLCQVLAANLDLLFPSASEENRELAPADAERVRVLFDFLLERLGPTAILPELLQEVSATMAQRPVVATRAEALLHAAGRALAAGTADEATAGIARHWLGALEAPSVLAQAHDLDGYREALARCDHDQLTAEAGVFGASMNETGLVSSAHAVLVTHLAEHDRSLVGLALALDDVGRACLQAYAVALMPILSEAITPPTARALYGLSRLLNAGVLFNRPVLPGLQRLSRIALHPDSREALIGPDGAEDGSATTRLLAGTLSVLGQPRGIDQGHNPTCQSARAISLWAQNDPGFLLDLIAQAARDDDVVMDFEGEKLRASALGLGMARSLHPELDAVSRLLTPHIDRVYVEMGRRTVGRVGDGHRWVNPEMHGWWVMRDFAELIDIAQGAIAHCDDFLRCFYSAYHPEYNGDRALVYAQPCGIASTTSNGTWVGWHAIAIQRIARDPQGDWRVYFFNPNRDKAQNWGQGIVTSTHEADELEGESSLLFEQFAARLYVFHYRAEETGDPSRVPGEAIARIRTVIANGWGSRFAWID